MPPSPRLSRHSRNSSATDSFAGSLRLRRHSVASGHDHFSSSFGNELLGAKGLVSEEIDAPNTLGSLADELADAFSDSDGDEAQHGAVKDDAYEHEEARAPRARGSSPAAQDAKSSCGLVDGGHGSDGSAGARGGSTLSIPSPRKRSYHGRSRSEYDGSEYRSESEFETTDIAPSLLAKINTIDSLARRGTGVIPNDAFSRLTEELRKLASQAAVESGASRLITGNTALSTHLAHQARQLHSLTLPLMSPLAPPPDVETLDELVPLLLSLIDAMPRPLDTAATSLTALRSITADLVQTLSYLSDSLHMSRQTTVTATRRLRSARELVSELRRDEELREEGERWLLCGDWGERLQNRECAGVCGEVIGGFEDICSGWRQRLLAQAEPRV